MRVQQVVVGLAVTFTTWLLLGVVAAFLNVPNFDAKLEGQDCACAINPLLGDLDIHVKVGNLLLSIWILLPALAFSTLAVAVFFIRPKWILDRRKYIKGLKRAAILGEVIGVMVAAAIILEAAVSNSIIVYPAGDQEGSVISENIAENFEFTLLNGTRVKLYDFAGRPTLLEFMWTGCGHCKNQTRALNEVYDALGHKVNLISVAVTWGRDDLRKLSDFEDRYGVEWLSGVDGGSGTERYGANEVPMMFILDRGWKIMYTHTGQVSAGVLASELNEVLKIP